MKLTVITVCFNAEKELRKTIESVLSQSYVDYEYLIVDGKSTDASLDIINSYESSFAKKEVAYRIVSEKDSGIYNAMNKAVRLAQGEWVIFMNAGDYFCNEYVLEKVYGNTNLRGIEVIYGDTIVQRDNLFKIEPAKALECIKEDMPFCHQSTFTLRSLLVNNPYDESLKICADHDFYLNCYLKGRKFLFIDIYVSVYILGGFSWKSGIGKYLRERIMVRKKNVLIREEEYAKELKKLKRFLLCTKIKGWIKSVLFKKIMQKKLAKNNECEGWQENMDILLENK